MQEITRDIFHSERTATRFLIDRLELPWRAFRPICGKFYWTETFHYPAINAGEWPYLEHFISGPADAFLWDRFYLVA